MPNIEPENLVQPNEGYWLFDHLNAHIFNSQNNLNSQISKALKTLPEPAKPTPQLLQEINDLVKTVSPILFQE
jgi:hypothetical protein